MTLLALAPYRRQIRGFLHCLSLFFWAFASLARAQEDFVPRGLALKPGITCLERSSLAHALDHALASQGLGREQYADLAFEVQGSAHDPRTAVIRVARGDQVLAQRSFRPGPPRCADFHHAVALALVLMLKSLDEPDAPSTTTATEPAPQPAPSNLASPDRAEAASPPARPSTVHMPLTSPPKAKRRPVPWGWSARASALLSKHVGADFASGARIELGIAPLPLVQLHLGMLMTFARAEQLADTQVRYVTRPWAVSLSGCANVYRHPAWTLRACAGLLAGRIWIHAQGAQRVQTLPPIALRWISMQGQLELAVGLARSLSLLLSLSPVYSLRQLGVSTDNADGSPTVRERLPRFGALFAMGFAFDFVRQGSPPRAHE